MTTDTQSDPLGPVIEQHQVTLAGILIVSGFVGAVGLGVLACGLVWKAWAMGFLAIGTAMLVGAGALVIMNLSSLGRRLELRKGGIRFVDSGNVTELFWDDIVNVEVNRTDATNMGAATIFQQSSDAVRPSGLLTKTEWDVRIHTCDGRSIRLSPIFLQMVPDPKKLISHLRMRAGV